VDSERASCESLRRAILEITGFDIPHDFPSDFNDVFGMDVRNCITHYKGKFGHESWDVEAIASAVSLVKEGIYEELTASGIQAFTGARELVLAAKRAGILVGVGSSGSPEKIRRNLTSSGLIDAFDPSHVVSAKHVGRGKPAPDVYLEVMRRLGCDNPKQALIIEDAVNGLLAAKAAGAYAVGVTTSLPKGRLVTVADAVVDNLAEMYTILGLEREHTEHGRDMV